MTTWNMHQPLGARPRLPGAPDDAEALFTSPPLPAPASALRARGPRDVAFGRCEVSVARREVLVDGQLRTLQPRPFDLLVYLIEHRHRVVSTDELLDHIWKDEFVQPGSLAAAVMRIRKALAGAGHEAGAIIRTHQGIGYRFVAALDDDAPRAPSAHADQAASAGRAPSTSAVCRSSQARSIAMNSVIVDSST
ncbi:MAG: winged helix-turn-helix transcriptional regulator [Burkholderiales bacterium]|nr:winged helix-turn-helix transcriptional regulator [Burkholderiales bacterium]